MNSRADERDSGESRYSKLKSDWTFDDYDRDENIKSESVDDDRRDSFLFPNDADSSCNVRYRNAIQKDVHRQSRFGMLAAQENGFSFDEQANRNDDLHDDEYMDEYRRQRRGGKASCPADNDLKSESSFCEVLFYANSSPASVSTQIASAACDSTRNQPSRSAEKSSGSTNRPHQTSLSSKSAESSAPMSNFAAAVAPCARLHVEMLHLPQRQGETVVRSLELWLSLSWVDRMFGTRHQQQVDTQHV
jgi:hypothetical protein